MLDVVAIEAGIAGLSAARELVRAGLSVRVLEAALSSGRRAASEVVRFLEHGDHRGKTAFGGGR